jgi:hypothetical protein
MYSGTYVEFLWGISGAYTRVDLLDRVDLLGRYISLVFHRSYSVYPHTLVIVM